MTELEAKNQMIVIMRDALTEISKDVYELNPWTICKSNTATIAESALAEVKEIIKTGSNQND